MKGSDKGKPMVAAPGELYSTAQGAPVASTEQIYDYLKEKSQETINTEVQQKLNELEANQGGNDGLDEQQVQTKIDTSLQSLNTENSGTLGSAVAALASAVGNNTSTKSHEERITALESTSPTDYSERLNTIEGNISDLGTGLSDANTSIQAEKTRAKGAETRLEGLINNLDEDIEDLNNELNNINSNILLQFKEKRTGTISDTSRFHAETTGCNPTAVFYYEQYKRFMVERNGQIFGYWGCGNAYNDYSPNGEDATPFKNRIYVDQNKLVYTWDGVTLRALGLQFENSSDDSGSQEDPEETPITIPEVAYGDLNTATEYSYYTVTETTSGIKYKIGTLQVVNSPEGIIQILTTPKDINNNTYESDSVHVYVRSKQGSNWASWVEDTGGGGGNPITTINTNKVNDVPFNKNQQEINDILNRYINLERGTFNEVTTDMLQNKSVTMEKLSSTVYEYIHNIDDMMGELSHQAIKVSNLINEVNTLKALQSQNLFTEISVEGLFIVDKLGNIGACIAPATITNEGSSQSIVVNYGWNGSGSIPEGTIEWKPGKGQKLVLDVDFSQTTNFDPIQDELYAIKFNIPSKDSTNELLKFQAIQKSDSSYEGLRLMIETDCVKLGNSYFYYIDSNNNEVQIPYSEIEISEDYDLENETQYRRTGHPDIVVQQSERPEEPYAEKNLQFEIVSGSNYTYLEPVQEVDGKTYLVLKINSGVNNKNVTVRCTDTTTDTSKDITVNVTFAIPGYNFIFTVEDNNNTQVGEGENGIPYVTTTSETNSFDVGFQADGQSNEIQLVNNNTGTWWSLPSVGIQPVTMTKNLQYVCRLQIVKDVVNKTFTLTYNLKYKDLYYGDPEEFSIGYLKKQIKVSYQQSSGGSDSGTTPNLGGRGVIVDDASSQTQVTEIGTHTKTLYLKDASTGAILKAEWVGDDSLNLDVHNDEEVPYVEVTVLDTTKEFYVLNASAIIE